MMKEQLRQEQSLFYKIFSKQCESKQFSHAYLLEGNYQTLEAALYMAASLVCQHSQNGACEQCSRCQRVFELNYPDLIYIDGKSTSIKKEDILRIQQRFKVASIEENSRKIYILDGVENASDEALNSLLKFLEEPEGKTTVGILITKQRHLVLPTILSRCQVYRLNDTSQTVLIEKARAMEIDEEEAFFLSRILHNTQQLETMEEDQTFKAVIGQLKEFINAFFKDKPLGVVYLQSLVSSKKIDRESLKLFVDFFILYCKELMIDHSCFDSISRELIDKNKPAILHYLSTSITIRDRITRSVNVGLLVDQWGYMLMEGNS